MPTDGLVLRGRYTTITLAVYGTLTANVAEQLLAATAAPAAAASTPAVPAPQPMTEVQEITTMEGEWRQDRGEWFLNGDCTNFCVVSN